MGNRSTFFIRKEGQNLQLKIKVRKIMVRNLDQSYCSQVFNTFDISVFVLISV